MCEKLHGKKYSQTQMQMHDEIIFHHFCCGGVIGAGAAAIAFGFVACVHRLVRSKVVKSNTFFFCKAFEIPVTMQEKMNFQDSSQKCQCLFANFRVVCAIFQFQ